MRNREWRLSPSKRPCSKETHQTRTAVCAIVISILCYEYKHYFLCVSSELKTQAWLKIQRLLDDAEQSTGANPASLVEAVRSIARQERAEAADIDVHEQLRSALGVLDHKLKNARVALSGRLLFVALARLFRQRQPHLLDAIAALIETPSGSGRPPTRSDRCAMARAACR